MSRQNNLITGILLGAGAAYLLDPEWGQRRRAMVREQASRLNQRLNEDLVPAVQQARDRAADAAAGLRNRLDEGSGGFSDTIRRLPGVQQVVDRMESTSSSTTRTGPAGGWDPGTRLALGSLGGLLALQGAPRLGFLGPVVRAAGLGLIARAATNRPAQRPGPTGPARPAVPQRSPEGAGMEPS